MFKTLLTASTLAVLSTTALARESIAISGSSTVLPYAIIVAEAFGENFEFPTPVVEGGGSGSGRKRLCEGTGENTIDIANSSSKMKADEWERCEAVVGPVTEIRIGYDGIVFAIGTLDVFGVDGNLAWDRVYQANMLKHPGVKPGRPNPFGLPDLLKPDGWEAPSHEGNHGTFSNIL